MRTQSTPTSHYAKYHSNPCRHGSTRRLYKRSVCVCVCQPKKKKKTANTRSKETTSSGGRLLWNASLCARRTSSVCGVHFFIADGDKREPCHQLSSRAGGIEQGGIIFCFPRPFCISTIDIASYSRVAVLSVMFLYDWNWARGPCLERTASLICISPVLRLLALLFLLLKSSLTIYCHVVDAMDDKAPLTPSSEAANFDIGSIQVYMPRLSFHHRIQPVDTLNIFTLTAIF